MKTFLEWTDKEKAMHDALRALNTVLLECENLEETAFGEALNVKTRLDAGNLTELELVDYLNQAAIDLLVHKRS